MSETAEEQDGFGPPTSAGQLLARFVELVGSAE